MKLIKILFHFLISSSLKHTPNNTVTKGEGGYEPPRPAIVRKEAVEKVAQL